MARTSNIQKKTKKTKLQTTCPQSQTRAPMGSAVLFFCFFGFSRFLHGLLQMARTSKIQKKQKKIADHMSTESDKSPNGVCSFVFYFRCFCMVCSRWPEPRKSKKPKKNCRPHVHRVRQEPQWGLQFWFFWFFGFLDFRGFCMVCYRWPEPRKSKKIQKKQNCRPHVHRVRQEPQWGLQFCFLVFFGFSMFLHGLLCCILLLSYQIALYSAKSM